MTTHLKITTVYADGYTEMHDQDWPGWNLEAAASVMRARRCVATGGLRYDLPLTDRQLEVGIIRQHHEWSNVAVPSRALQDSSS
ncbi:MULTISPECIES: hypothetical protein [Brachybacterium]|uniref:Uncharacterized protein n=1 Tax=Brachybacterium kimchii TaxID=2942909 RepID=A0ABY4N7M6_9MICO|nr:MULTISPECIES: hypothetical protein [Brachybacterium]MCG7309705.1 hypothetical protein [Brachybacterium sp. ACRRE]UQN30552.1 hypothetical protein M4486_04365 [Brachybacterium kimchii]